MAIRIGFHRLGLVVAVPLATTALACLVVAAFLLINLPPSGTRVVGPDYRPWHFAESTTTLEISAHLTREYKRPITVGFGVDQIWPTNPRAETWDLIYGWSAGALAAALLALFLYIIAWAFGWVIAGFRHEP